eukprot:scaffold2078_cov41-Attheya_sp.AAC.3
MCKDLAMCCLEDDNIVDLQHFFQDLLVKALDKQRANPEQALFIQTLIQYDRVAEKAAKVSSTRMVES